MAYICEKPKGFCKKCSHFRYDEDYGGMACFAKVDLEAVSASAKELNTVATTSDYGHPTEH